MSTVEILADSIEYLSYPITATDADGVAVDPTGDAVSIAFRAVRDTAALDWQTAAWDADADTPTVRILFGTGVFALAAGVFDVYLRITDSTETPILSAGTLYVA
jgi:hypothetical protein